MSTTCRRSAKPMRQVVPSPGSMLAVRWLMRTIVLRYSGIVHKPPESFALTP